MRNFTYLSLCLLMIFISCDKDEIVYEPNLDRPINLSATKGEFVDKIILSWESTPSTNLYEIYRYDSSVVEYTKIGETEEKSFVDSTVTRTNLNYYYKVRIYNTEKEFSDFSDITYGYIDDFKSIREINIENGETVNYILLSWTEIKGADEYEIYRSNSLDSDYEKLSTTEDNSYEDEDIELLTNYYYKIRAINFKLGASDFSNIDSGYVYEKYNLVKTIGSDGWNNGQFRWPYGILFDSQDNFYVSEMSGGRIQKFDSDGNFINVFTTGSSLRGIEWSKEGTMFVAGSGSSTMFEYNLSGVQIDSWNNSFRYFREIDVDDDGNIYVTDSDNNRIQKFDKDKNFLLKWGSLGTGDNQFDFPWGLEVVENQVIVSDGNFVRFFSLTGEFIKKWDLNSPVYYISVYDGWLYFACSNYILKTDIDGKVLSKIGIGDIELAHGIGFDSTGKVFVVDSGTHTVKVFVIEN